MRNRPIPSGYAARASRICDNSTPPGREACNGEQGGQSRASDRDRDHLNGVDGESNVVDADGPIRLQFLNLDTDPSG